MRIKPGKVENFLLKKKNVLCICSTLFKTNPLQYSWAPPVALVVKNPPANAGDIGEAGLIPGSGRSSGEGHGNHSTILA